MTWNSIGIESKFQRLLLDYCDGSLEFGDGGGDGIGDGFYFFYGNTAGGGESTP